MTTATANGKEHDPHRLMKISIAILLGIVAAIWASASGEEGHPALQVEHELIPGADRMTDVERDIYRRRTAAASGAREKAKIRAEYAQAVAPSLPKALVGSAARGSKIHQACFGCHGVERYTQAVTHAMATFTDSVLRASGLSDIPPAEPARFKGKVRSLEALRDMVVRRGEFFDPKMTPQEVADVVAYLNETYYKFPQ